MDHSRQPHDLLMYTKDLTRWYPGSPSMTFYKLNIWLYKHDFCLVTGKSGSGKTTLAKLLMGQYSVPKKMLYHKQEDMSRFSPREVQELRRKIGAVFQDHKLIGWKTVRENISFPLSLLEMPLAIKHQTIDNIIKQIGLIHQSDVLVSHLSEGEKQLVCLARALVHRPEFLLIDEPSGNLDPEQTRRIADILIQMHDVGHTILLLTHDEMLAQYVREHTKVTEYKL